MRDPVTTRHDASRKPARTDEAKSPRRHAGSTRPLTSAIVRFERTSQHDIANCRKTGARQ